MPIKLVELYIFLKFFFFTKTITYNSKKCPNILTAVLRLDSTSISIWWKFRVSSIYYLLSYDKKQNRYGNKQFRISHAMNIHFFFFFYTSELNFYYIKPNKWRVRFYFLSIRTNLYLIRRLNRYRRISTVVHIFKI